MRELVGLKLWGVAMCWQRALNRALKPHGLTQRQYVVLDGVARLLPNCECVTQSALAAHTHGDAMTTSSVLRLLEERGLVERGEHPTDSRANSISLTVAGRALLVVARESAEAVDREMFGAEPDLGLIGVLAALLGSS